MKNHNIDLTVELVEILRFVSFVTKAIRICSEHNSDYNNYPKGDFDVMWLSDSLHKLDLLTEAIETGNGETINSVARDLTDLFERYVNPTKESKSDPRDIFVKWKLVSATTDTFRAIAEKTRKWT